MCPSLCMYQRTGYYEGIAMPPYLHRWGSDYVSVVLDMQSQGYKEYMHTVELIISLTKNKGEEK